MTAERARFADTMELPPPTEQPNVRLPTPMVETLELIYPTVDETISTSLSVALTE